MRRLAALVVLAVACGPKQPHSQPPPQQQPPQPQPQPDPAMAEVIAALRLHRDRMCACTDAACVEQVEVEQFEWGFAHKELVDHAKPTKAQQDEATTLIEATEECAHKHRPDA